MSGGREFTADGVAAAIAGHANGRQAGAVSGDAAHDGRCLNCGTLLIGEHCHSCGQSAHVHRSIGAIGHEIAHGVFHFEGKIWRTLPLLTLRPGELTRRYAAGERAKFVSPLAVFLFSVFLMFAIVANLPGYKLGGENFLEPGVSARVAETRVKVIESRKQEQAELADLQRRLSKERADPTPDPERLASLAERINRRSASIRDLGRLASALPSPEATPSRSAGENWFEAKFRHARENPELVLYKLKTSAYKYSWALIPLSIPMLWLLFPFSRRFALYDHAIFVTYSLSFMSLLTIVLAVLGAVGVGMVAISTAGTIIPIVHIYKQMKGAYSLGRWSALIRTFLLVNLIFWMVVPVFTLVMVYMGVG